MMTPSRIAVLLALLALSVSAFSQPPIEVDYRISISQGGVPAVGVDVVYALVIEANWSTDWQEPFVARLTVPRELEVGPQCNNGEFDTVTFDAGTRVLTWSGRLDNPYIAFKSCPLISRVHPSVAPGTPFVLHATLTTSKPDPNPSNDTATIGGVVVATSDLRVESSANMQRFRPGTTFEYTIRVANAGPLEAHDVVLSDQFSPHVTFVSLEHVSGPAAVIDPRPFGNIIDARIPVLPADAVTTFRLVVTANTSFEAADILNRASAHSTSFDPAERNNESLVATYAGPRADLAITGVRGPETLTRQTPIHLQVSNNGPDAVNHVTVHHSLRPTEPSDDFLRGDAKFVSVTPSQGVCAAPVLRQTYIDHYPNNYWSVDCDLGALAPGARATLDVVVERTSSSGVVPYAAFVGPMQNDPRPENNQTPAPLTPRRRSVRK